MTNTIIPPKQTKQNTQVLTAEKLKAILPACREPNEWVIELNQNLPNYDITTKERIASFLAQTGHESGDFNILEENLNYSLQGLLKIFPKYFANEQIAAKYARQPKLIASRVYANRMGNGDESTGDGWKYRGRGLIQITGKNNYAACSKDLFGDEKRLLENPDLLLEKKYALLSALWFWKKMNLNKYANDILQTTKLVNGGTNGLKHRQEIYERALKVL